MKKEDEGRSFWLGGTGVGKDFLILTWRGNLRVVWTAAQTPAQPSPARPSCAARSSKQSGRGVQFCRLRSSVFRAFPPGLVTVVCLKLVLVWPVGESELQSLGFTLGLLHFRFWGLDPLSILKAERRGPKTVMPPTVCPRGQRLSPGLIGQGAPRPKTELQIPMLRCLQSSQGVIPSRSTCSCPRANVASRAVTAHLVSSWGLPGTSSNRVTLGQDTAREALMGEGKGDWGTQRISGKEVWLSGRQHTTIGDWGVDDAHRGMSQRGQRSPKPGIHSLPKSDFSWRETLALKLFSRNIFAFPLCVKLV